MPKAGEIRYCPELGGREKNAAFVWIPPGSFWMGDKSRNDNPVRFVTLTKGFWLQQTPLTERQYSGQSSNLPQEIGEPAQENISWNDVSNFCRGKPLRVPTEAEWEYAVRSNTGHKYLWSGSNVVDNVAWISKNSVGHRLRVGSLKPNNRGLFDMSGNVYERCHDLYDSSLSTVPQLNPTGPASGPYRVNRGGSWASSPQATKVAFRNYAVVDFLTSGVRLIWEPTDA